MTPDDDSGTGDVRLVRPSLPPLADLQPYLEKIWDSRWLTNAGPLHGRLEAALCDYLGVEHLALVGNATLGLVAAMKVAESQQGMSAAGEVITTPFTFVATANAIRFAGHEPVFADIDPFTLNLSPAAVEPLITERTRAILAVHAFGVPCDVDGLEALGRKHGIPVIYDAAHAFGVRHRGQGLAAFGDYSVLSFHATKVFNTFEGGAVVCQDAAAKRRLDQFSNNGFESETEIALVGLNAKMSELHAAVGLAQLPYVGAEIKRRAEVTARYCAAFREVDGIRCICPENAEGHNYYAMPILLGEAYPLNRDQLWLRMKEAGIVTRRYFHPLVCDMEGYRDLPSGGKGRLSAARAIAERILCLPLYPDIGRADQQRVIDRIRQFGR
ncbi:DegT/DnrJ/EryC1/StrS family aminotransferase [Algicella marina]|uniref:DegT/DnrJ/EryC1/StrS family aminotransferase n=2 Tax=Algicella marina TaxID=2683284 RepID=A0A6P1T6N4_9RHOB|nr:DegT/DnrJ/EryC1/StrS family aminotransferase [Algicella marina]